MIYNKLEPPTVILSTKSHSHLGSLRTIDYSTLQIVRNMNSAQEISFDVHKEFDGEVEPLWESIVSFKYIYLPSGGVITNENGEYFSIEVAVDDTNETVKHITGTSACEFELSKRKLYDFEINTNADIEFQTQEYKRIYDKEPEKEVVETWRTKFYNDLDHEHSLLHRVIKDKCPDYSIGTVEPDALAKTQRTFSANGQSIYDFLTQTVAKEFECVFEFDSVNRTINAYSLRMHCNNCEENGPLAATCPNCGSSDYHNYYGESTNIFISAENYAQQISCNGDTDNVFNCLRVSGGDNIMTTSFMYINPTGTQYLYRFSDDMYADMPTALVNKIREYNEMYDEKKDDAEQLSEDYFNALDVLGQYKHGVPSLTPVVTTADQEADELPGRFQDFVRDNHYIVVMCGDSISAIDTPPNYTSANNTIKGLAEVLVDARYNVEANGTLSGSGTDTRLWTGTVEIKNKGNEEDKQTTETFSVTITRVIDQSVIPEQDTAAQYIKQRILKRMDRDDRYFRTIYDLPDSTDQYLFRNEITRLHTTGDYVGLPVYGLEILKAYHSSYEACVNIMVENGVTDVNSEFYGMELYNEMYKPFAERLEILTGVIGTRATQIDTQQKAVDNIKEDIDALHNELNFENYLGTELFEIFSHYRMESEYTNSNYTSDGLSNAVIIERARELYGIASKEVVKASELQYTLSCSLNNLLQDKRFEGFSDKIKIGNWLTLLSDDKLYRLRLTQLTVDYGNLADIGVTFSDAIRVGGTLDDVQSVLSKASSMSSTYDTVAHQSKQGEVAHERVIDWVADGLNTALVELKNNNTEEVTYDQNGILLRSYDDIFDGYSPYQCRMTHNVLAFTKDNWNTCALAIGQSKYARYVESGNRGSITTNNYGYGVCAEFVSAGYVYGSQIIAGDIYSSNYIKVTDASTGIVTERGSHIDLEDGTFSLGSGQIRYDGTNLLIGVGNKNVNALIDHTVVQFCKNTSETIPPAWNDTNWSTSVPSRSDGEYIWQRIVEYYIDGSDNINDQLVAVNVTGKDGVIGRGVENIIEYYAKNNDSSNPPPWNQFTPTVVTPTSTEKYLWNYEVTEYDDGTQGEPTDRHVIGTFGDDGRGISSIENWYQVNNSTTAPTSGWSQDASQKKPTATNRYLWNYEVVNYTSGSPYTSDPRIICVYGETGRGIKGTPAVTYNTGANGTTPPSSGWQSSPVQTTDAKPYAWVKTVTTYTDDTTSTEYTVTKQGSKGSPGTGVASIVTKYRIGDGESPGAATQYNNWSTSLPEFTTSDYNDPNRYYWSTDYITYDDGSSPTYSTVSVLYGITAATRASHEAEVDAAQAASGVQGLSEHKIISVGSGGYLGVMDLSASPTTATSNFLVATTNIQFIADGELNLTSNTLKITTTSGAFNVTSAGKLSCTGASISGEITATKLTLEGTAKVPSNKVDGLATVATSGSYNDLSNKPTIPDTSLFIQKDGKIGSTPAEGATGFIVSSQGLLQASNAIIYGTLYASAGMVGGWTIEDGNLRSVATVASGTNSVNLNSQWKDSGQKINGYTVYQSFSNKGIVNSTASCTITISGYTEFRIMCRSYGEPRYDFLCVGNLDVTGVTKGTSNIKNFSTNDDTSATIYTEIVFYPPNTGTHTIELAYIKDTSQDHNDDCAYFYIPDQGSMFNLSTSDFSQTINGTLRSGLRMSVAGNFAVDKNGKLYASNVDLSGKIEATSGYIGNSSSGWSITSSALYNTTTDPDASSLGAILSTNTGYTFTTGGSYYSKVRLTSDSIRFYANSSLSNIQNYPSMIYQSDGEKGILNVYNRSSSPTYRTELIGTDISMYAGSNTILNIDAINKNLSIENIRFGDSWQYSPAPFMTFSINSGSSQRINLTYGTRATLIFNTAYGNGNGIGNLYRESSSSGGNSRWAAMVTPSSVTVTAATQGTTIANSTGSVLYVGVIIFTGTVTLA